MSGGIIFTHPWDYLEQIPPSPGLRGYVFQIVPRVSKNDTPPPHRVITDIITVYIRSMSEGNVFTTCVHSTREGTVFTGVCLSTSRRGGTYLLARGGYLPSQVWTGRYRPSQVGGRGTYLLRQPGGVSYLPRSGWGGYLPSQNGGVPNLAGGAYLG